MVRPQTASFLSTYVHIHTQTNATKHINLLRIRAQGNK